MKGLRPPAHRSTTSTTFGIWDGEGKYVEQYGSNLGVIQDVYLYISILHKCRTTRFPYVDICRSTYIRLRCYPNLSIRHLKHSALCFCSFCFCVFSVCAGGRERSGAQATLCSAWHVQCQDLCWLAPLGRSEGSRTARDPAPSLSLKKSRSTESAPTFLNATPPV